MVYHTSKYAVEILLHDMINRRVVLFVVCVYILRSIRSADCVELPVFLYLLQCLVYHMLSEMRRGSGICI